MSRPYRLSAEARQQIDAVGAFVADDNVEAALKIYDALEDAFQLLAENPGIGHTREDLTTAGEVLERVVIPRSLRPGEQSPSDHHGSPRRSGRHQLAHGRSLVFPSSQ